jgi:hypothetical protein
MKKNANEINTSTMKFPAGKKDVVVNKSCIPNPENNYRWYVMPMNGKTFWTSTREAAIEAAQNMTRLSGGEVLIRA